MALHTSSPERAGRLYANESYADNPATGPIAMRAIRAAYLRRVALRATTDQTLRRIDRTLGSSTPPEQPSPPEHREDPPDYYPPVRSLGKSAISAASQIESRAA